MDHGYYYPQQPMAPEVPVAPDVYNYEQYAAQRSKTPTSLVNHTGLSPGGPLSTPPMSRDASRGPDPPPGQYPEQMVYGSSPSDSPTSVQTPDNDSLEELTLDPHPMREFHPANGGVVATQVSQGPLTGIDQNLFLTAQGTISDQGLHSVYRLWR
jgi:hypothetical protein